MPEELKVLKISGGNTLLDPYSIFEQVGLGAGEKMADLGCGAAGHFVLPAAKIVGEQGTVYAVDLLKSVLEAVKSRAKLEGVGNVKTVWSNLEIYGATEIKEESLDMVLLANTLFQIPKREEVLREAVRLAKKGGKIVVVEWGLAAAPLGPSLDRRLSKDVVRQMAAQNGLTEVKEFKAGPYHYGLVFSKN
ncbi:class I SAM-dependent methyltransferase [Patescibacteria group bacterium]|nr:class I SAM-dependent methyltransferase [Patescibacteria group bacterium]